MQLLQRVKFGKEQYEAIKKFEVQHHGDFWKLIMDKVSLILNLILNLTTYYPNKHTMSRFF